MQYRRNYKPRGFLLVFDDRIFLYLIKAIVMILLRHKNFIDLKWQEQSDYNLIRNLKVNYKPYKPCL